MKIQIEYFDTFSFSGNYFASGSDDKMVYIWKTNFDEFDEQLGITSKTSKSKEQKVKYSIEPPAEQEENEEPKGILKEKSINVQESSGSSSSDSEISKLSAKMDTILKTLMVMDKRLTLVEDQLRAIEKN